MSQNDDKVLYSGEVTYDAAAVRRMERIRFRTFQLGASAMRILCAGIMVVCGYLMGGTTGILFVAFGCILAVSRDIVGRWRCEQTVKALQGRSIPVKYEFFEDSFHTITDGQRQACDYAQLICLMEDDRCFYLYPNEYQIYMVSKESVKPQDPEGLKTLVARSAGVSWIRPLSLLTANLKQIIAFQREVGKKRFAKQGSR